MYRDALSGGRAKRRKNKCPVCAKPLWEDRKVADVLWGQSCPFSEMKRLSKYVPAGDPVVQLVCGHHVHQSCMSEHCKNPANLLPSTRPGLQYNAACPQCRQTCSMWHVVGKYRQHFDNDKV